MLIGRRFIDGFDTLASDVRRSTPIRLIAIAILGLVFAENVGWRNGALWIAAGVCTTVCGHVANRAPKVGAAIGAPLRLVRLIAMVAGSLIWTTIPVTYWMTGVPALRMVALVILCSLLIVAQGYSFRSVLAVFAFGAAPGLATVVLPIFLGGFSGLQLVSIGVGLAMTLVYWTFNIRQNITNANVLLRAQAELLVQKETADAANQAKSAFLAMMSHELRTPMNGVLGMAHALTTTSLDDRQKNYVEMLTRSGKNLLSILNDILDVSKIESGKLELEDIPFDLHELGQRVIDLWTETADAKGVRLVYDLAADTPRWVRGDPTRLQQIMTNLISNALKFTSVGEVRLSIRSVSATTYEITVLDTGLGIPDAQQARLFQSFTQADVSTTRKFGGTGLGLAICKQLVTLMGGEIHVTSQEGKGSAFTASISLAPADPVEPTAETDEQVGLEGMRILVADDNPINQAVVRAILEACGATVTGSGDGRDALERLKTGSFEGVLMDVHMPNMGGIEALGRIRAGEAGAPDISVIALTADAMAGADSALLAEGFDGVAPKPINPAELVAMIAELCPARAA